MRRPLSILELVLLHLELLLSLLAVLLGFALALILHLLVVVGDSALDLLRLDEVWRVEDVVAVQTFH